MVLAALLLLLAERHRIACDFGAQRVKALVEQAKGKSTLLSDQPVRAGRASAPAGADAMVLEWNAFKPVNLFAACPQLRDVLPENFHFATSDEWALASRPLGLDPIYIEELAEPLVSEDGQFVVYQQTSRCTGLCGGGWIGRYERHGSDWYGPVSLALWMS
jgi:hypothetical protein